MMGAQTKKLEGGALMLRLLALFALVAEQGAWELIDTSDGIALSSREVPGERVVELRATTTSKLDIEALCNAAYGSATLDKSEPDVTVRKLDQRIGQRAHHLRAGHGAGHQRPRLRGEEDRSRARRRRQGAGCASRRTTHTRSAAAEGLPCASSCCASWTFEPQPDGRVKVHVPHLPCRPGRRPARGVRRGAAQEGRDALGEAGAGARRCRSARRRA